MSPALEEMRSLVESIDTKYAELAKDRQVADVLAEQGRTLKSKLKLGSSPQYRNVISQMKTMEKHVDSPNSMIQPDAKRPSKRKNQKKDRA